MAARRDSICRRGPIIADTEGAAWDKAGHILEMVKTEVSELGPQLARDHSGERIMTLAEKADIYDERLWMPLAAAYGTPLATPHAWWARPSR